MRTRRIAVVNDDTIFLDLMEQLLREEGYATTIMKISHEAFERLKREPPDLIVLDIWMGKPENGWELLNLLRLDPATARLPVIVSSTDVRDLEAKAPHLRAMGCDTLLKPFDLDTLLDKVNEAIGPPTTA